MNRKMFIKTLTGRQAGKLKINELKMGIKSKESFNQ